MEVKPDPMRRARVGLSLDVALNRPFVAWPEIGPMEQPAVKGPYLVCRRFVAVYDGGDRVACFVDASDMIRIAAQAFEGF